MGLPRRGSTAIVMAWVKLRLVVRCFMSKLDIRKLRVTCQLLIATYLSITNMAVPERIELSHSARQADIMATRSWDQLVQAVGIEPTGSKEPRFYGPVPYLHGGACKMAEETGVEPACARISDTDWFSGPASHRGTPLPFWRRVRDLNSRHPAVLLVSSEVV